MKYKICSFSLLLLVLFSGMAEAQNYLSILNAGRNDPLFTTYAAPLARSEFIVDEGYRLLFYDDNDGIKFITDTAGELALAFKLNSNVHFLLNQMHSEPVITTSYSDLVKFRFQPYEGVEVQVFFQVYSSRIAIEDVTVTNRSSVATDLDIYPFLFHPSLVENTSISTDHRAFAFLHHEYPDGWTLGHNVPYQADLQNIYLFSEAPDGFGSYDELGSVPPPGSQANELDNYCVEWGTVNHADGSPCTHAPPDAQQIILHNGSVQEILTEDAPKWGDPDPNIPGNGYQGCELGNFRNSPVAVGDSFTVVFTCLASDQQGISGGLISALPATAGVRTDIQLSQSAFPPTPQNVNVQFSLNNTSAVVNWTQVPGYLYSVYRRTASTPGRYDLLVENLNSTAYMDLGLNPDSSYAYTIICRDSAGKFSGHSPEAGNINQGPLFADVERLHLRNYLTANPPKVVAFQKSISLQPGETKQLRIVRGVMEDGGNLDSLRAVCENLLVYDMEQAVSEDEALYSRIPRINIPDPDLEMMYWSAFSMMRQCMLPPEGLTSHNYNVYSREPTWGWGHGGQVFHENLSMLAYAFMDPPSAQESQREFSERIGSQPGWPAGYIPYRSGPYLNEINYWANEYTSAAPWFSWENWEVFEVSQDTTFLRQMYDYGRQFYDFWITHRDDDHDGLCEWGAHSFWESVRDYNVIWYVLGGWADPHNANKVEALDLNCELVMEARSLAKMAQALGRPQEAQQWLERAQVRADSINALMWDSQTHFYYHVEKHSHTFTYQSTNDLKHKEHIGFLPIWAGIADQSQVNDLVAELHDPNTFGKPYGSPLMDYSDPLDPSGTNFFHEAMYPEWDFLVFQGFIQHYNMLSEAQYLANRIFAGVVQTLKSHHDFYECYDVDTGGPYGLHTYIWTGVVARMLIDLYGSSVGISQSGVSASPSRFELQQNYPNPFNPATTISFILPRAEKVTLIVFDVTGRLIKTLTNQKLSAGNHSVVWDGADESGRQVASGVFFYQLQTGNFAKSRKMILIR